MSRSTRFMLMPGAAVAVAVSLAFGSVIASDDEEPMGSIDGMESMEEMEPGLYVRDAWARESPMLGLAGAAYMIVHNNTDADDALIGASSPAAEVVEIHLSSMDDERMMSMAQVQEIPIPAHADAVLKPGSYHIMLINLVEPLTEGTELEISLEFMNAEPQTITAPVQADGPMMGGMDMGDMDDHMDDMDDMDDDGHDMDDMDDEDEREEDS